jgi:hypothetical protein
MMIDIRNNSLSGEHLIVIAGQLPSNPDLAPTNTTILIDVLPSPYEWDYLPE